VTEYGIAYLHGRTLRERALALISIAHPDFRSELLHQAKRRRLVHLNQILPPPKKPYPSQYESTAVLRDGTVVRIRPIRPDDEPLMKEMFYSFTQQTVYLRFHSAIKAMPHEQLQLFCNIDYDTEMALVAVTGPVGQEEIIGMGRYLMDPSRDSAELAFVVRDDWQRKGLGTILFQRLIEIGKQNGIKTFWADVLVENSGMLKIFHKSGLDIESTKDGNIVHVKMRVPSKHAEPAAAAATAGKK